MPKIGACSSCGTPEGWPHGMLCATRAAQYPRTCHACCGHNGPHAPWCGKSKPEPRGFDPLRPWGMDELVCPDCQTALSGADGKGYRDGCDAHQMQRRMNAAWDKNMEMHKRLMAHCDPAIRERREMIERCQKLEHERKRLEGELKNVGEEMVDQTSRALKAHELLRRALPMLADLVPKFPDAEKLCAEIKAALDGTKTLQPAVGVWTDFSAPLVTSSRLTRHNNLFTGGLDRSKPGDLIHCMKCLGRWMDPKDVPEFCPATEPGLKTWGGPTG